MSKSYRKVWGWVDSNKWAKRQANKKVRHLNNITLEDYKGNLFKKAFCSYDICDWKYFYFSITSKKELAKEYDKWWQLVYK